MPLIRTATRWVFLVAIMVALLLLTLVVMEYATRWWYRDITTTGDNSSWFAHRWYLKDIGKNREGLNSLGFRDEEWPVVTERFRVAIVGDSFTYGQGIERHERFSARIQTALAELGADTKIMNLGKPGASARQNAFHLRQIEEYLPDFALIQFTANDFDDIKLKTTVPRNVPRNLMSRRDWHFWLHRKSALYYVANSGFKSLQQRAGGQPDYAEWLATRFADPMSEEGRTARLHMNHLINIAQRVAPDAGLVLFPVVGGSFAPDTYAFREMHQIALKVCQARQLDCLDLTPVFHAAGVAPDGLLLNVFDAHPNAVANEIASKAILEHFETRLRRR